jgi:hypothetical protein
MYALNILNDVIDLMQREICRSKQMTDFIAWPSRCHDMIHVDVSYQVSVHLVRQFQRRRFFRYRPIRKKNCLWWPCLLTDRDEMSILHRGHSIDASYQVSVNLTKRFQRRGFKNIGQSETRIACGGHVW